jgi:hypothetical protein
MRISNLEYALLLFICNDVGLAAKASLFHEFDLAKWTAGDKSLPFRDLQHSAEYR